MAELINKTEAEVVVSDDPLAFVPGAIPWATSFSDEQAGQEPYPVYDVTARYELKTGLVQMPVAGPKGTPARIVRLTSPTTLKTISWVVQRVGERPRLPHPDTGDPNDVLLYMDVYFPNPVLQPDGLRLSWLAQGVYVYACQLPLTEQNMLYVPTAATMRTTSPLAVEPWQWDTNVLRAVPTSGASQITF